MYDINPINYVHVFHQVVTRILYLISMTKLIYGALSCVYLLMQAAVPEPFT